MEKKTSKNKTEIAYFSMEIGIENDMPTYGGGLGILAGDTLKSAADLKVPMIGITLLNEKGYFSQKINENGEQIEEPSSWNKKKFLKKLDAEVSLNIEGRKVKVGGWEYNLNGIDNNKIPIIFLDTNQKENSEFDKTLTSYLYGGDQKYRICQEIVLGIGGVKMLHKLGYKNIKHYHMNEGHSAFLAVELYNKFSDYPKPIKEVRNKCVFTTHTPVPAGQDKFPLDLVKSVLPDFPFHIKSVFENGEHLNMTLLALFFSKHINGVAKKHKEVSRQMFPSYQIDSITNGVHSLSWTSKPFEKLFSKYVSGWKKDPSSLRYIVCIPSQEIKNTHLEAKKHLIDLINKTKNSQFNYETFTIGFARRATQYKRPGLLFYDIDRLKQIAKTKNLQIVYSGKAHPKDFEGKELIRKIISLGKNLGQNIKFVYLENYDMNLAKQLISGCDLWLNTPQRPKEASGTSGMKAAHNGVPSLSILDGWWIEGCIENVTGWAIGKESSENNENTDKEDAYDLYEKLDKITDLFYNNKEAWADIMKNTIAINASFYNTHRMLSQYVLNTYLI